MPDDCPVCGAEIEHARREREIDGSASTAAASAPQTTIDVAQLCNAPPDEGWDRICHRATNEERSDGQAPILEVFYHHDSPDG